MREHSSDNVDRDNVEDYIINQLIAGQADEGVYPAIPPDTKVISAETVESVCYINLSSEFSQFGGNTSLARLMVYSIVNSITENLVNIRRVQFQINSEIVQEFMGITDFNQPFERNGDLIPE
jgi:germination protein M